MPVEAKKFVKLDKDWAKLMAKAKETGLVIECCENEQLRTLLPVMYEELERCQKALDGYLEQKRGKVSAFLLRVKSCFVTNFVARFGPYGDSTLLSDGFRRNCSSYTR